MYRSQHDDSSHTIPLSRSALATVCAVVLSVAAGGAAFASTEGGAQASDRSQVATTQGMDYPDTDTMMKMYEEARASGVLDDAMYTARPSQAVLKSAYRYIMETSLRQTSDQDAAKGQTPSASSALAVTPQATDTCKTAMAKCIYESAKFGYEGFSVKQKARLFVCSIAAAGRNQDSPALSPQCSNIMEGADVCGNANDICGITSKSPILPSSFAGKTSGYDPKVVTCGMLSGGNDEDRALELGFDMKYINGVARATAVFIKCSAITSQWLGYGKNQQIKTRCPLSSTRTSSIEGTFIDVQNKGGLNTMSLRCDDVNSSSPSGDKYEKKIGFTSSDSKPLRAECTEGYYIWGVSAYFNEGAPGDQRYITGLSFLCRK